tara:strand:- start:144 stop:410 length:267 start_codon:yes stop_codon:yes gene_type:complete
MTKEEILNELTDRDLLNPNMEIILVDGFEEAFLGITVEKYPVAIYDYWICLDILVQKENLNFDYAIDSLDEFIAQDLGKHTPIYMKPV